MESANTKIGREKINWSKYAFEFLTMFIAILAAFALENWNDNRKIKNVETKILQEIKNGLQKDIEDIRINIQGHKAGIRAGTFWRQLVTNQSSNQDTLMQHYFNLNRDFVSILNKSGYESLKSNGLQIVKNDSLRFEIISLYEYDFKIMQKLEEGYSEMQFSSSYFHPINDIISKNFIFNKKGNLIGVTLPYNLTKEEENKFLSYLWKMESNRNFILHFYSEMEERVNSIIEKIEKT